MAVQFQESDGTIRVVPEWYAEMRDPDYWLACCKARAEWIAMTQTWSTREQRCAAEQYGV